MATDSDYECQLNAATLEKAIKELNEDPKNRLGAVETFRTWIQQQPHLRCRTDTDFLVQFLRYCKFSQLEARKRLSKYLSMMTSLPQWIADMDMTDPDCIKVLKTGMMLVLGTDDEGRLVTVFRHSQLDTSINKDKIYKAMFGATKLMLRDENVFVNGLVYVEDMTGMTMKHQTFFSLDDMKKMMDLFQNAYPARNKAFHYYNMGTIGETIMQMVLPFFKKKFRDRIVMHGDNLESIYKVVPMRLFPDEMLPDDYTGPSGGTYQSLTDDLVRRCTEPDNVAYLARITASNDFGVDESKRPDKNTAAPEASFRKLNID